MKFTSYYSRSYTVSYSTIYAIPNGFIPIKVKVKGTPSNAKKRIFRFQITRWIRLNFITLKNKEWLTKANLASGKDALVPWFSHLVIPKLTKKGREKFDNEKNRAFDYSMFHYRSDTTYSMLHRLCNIV